MSGRGNRWAPSWLTGRYRPLVVVGVATFVWAAMCNAVLSVAEGTNGIDSGFGMLLRENPLVFVFSTTLLWVLLLAVAALLGRVVPACVLVLTVTVAVAIANHQKIVLRGEPLYPSDLAFLREPGFLLDMAGGGMLVGVVVGVVLLVVATLLASRWVRRRLGGVPWARGSRGWYAWVAARVAVVLLAVVLVVEARTFHQSDNVVRRTYEALGVEWTPWSQRENYIRQGVVAGLLYNLDVTAMDRPEGYSPATMARLSDRYSALARRMNDGRTGSVRRTDVVVVLGEAFSDPTRVPGVELAEDPLPLTRELMTRTPSGSMLSPLIGGGTANVEFEVLTGQSISQFTPQMTTPYQMLVAKQDGTYPSAVSYFSALDHRTIAVHPYRPSMYQRDRVYPVLGFDRTVFEGQLAVERSIDKSKYVDDASAFDEVLRRLDETESPAFVQLVTMQNHYPMAGKYSDPIPASGVEGDTARQLEHYARGLRHSDQAMADFLDALERRDKDTAVVFYGDHTPAFWASSRAEDELGADADVFHETPYFLWSSDGRLRGERAEPVTSPIYFMPMLLDDLGAPLPPYYALLLRLQRELPALLPGSYRDASGEAVGEDDLSARARRLLDDYRLVQYDLSVGGHYAAGMFEPVRPGSRP